MNDALVPDWAKTLLEFATSHADKIALWSGGAALIVLLAALARRAWNRGRRPLSPGLVVPEIDLEVLESTGPTPDMAPLELYGLRVHLALAVMAPLGRASGHVHPNIAPALLDGIVPGLSQVAVSHRTRLLPWPDELSARGFVQRFFAHVHLPGRRGKGTPWSAIAGRFEMDGHPFVAGIVLRTVTNNSLGEFTVDRPNGWLDMLRIPNRP